MRATVGIVLIALLVTAYNMLILVIVELISYCRIFASLTNYTTEV